MGKIWAALGLALLAGCGSGIPYSPPTTKITVTIANTGMESASGEVREWHGSPSQSFTLAAGDSTTIQIEITARLKVHIERSSDSLVLLDDFWDVGDIKNDTLSLTVTP